MAFDLTSQHLYTWPGGGMVEAGDIDFSADSGATDVATTLVKCMFGFGISKANQTGQAFFVTTDTDITNSVMTWYRQTGDVDTSATCFYIAVGY